MENNNNIFQKILNSYSLRIIFYMFLSIVLLIPSFLIMDLINERIALSEGVKTELYKQWGGKQVIAGPVLNVPYTIPGEEKNPQEIHGITHFLPETLQTTAELFPEKRKRGIYEVVVYEGKLAIKGKFNAPDISGQGNPAARYDWNAAYFTLGITDMRGIKNLPELIINGSKYKVDPGVSDNDLFESGITVRAGGINIQQNLDFQIDLVLNGSEDLSVEALGKTSDVKMKSSWSEPGFTGNFLPVTRNVTSSGFNAEWKVTHLNRNFPQQWNDKKYNIHEAKLGTELLIAVDHYQKSLRSVKYAILFIALNFIIFIFIEMKKKKKINPFQYLLVAFALLIFYVLLISLGEQIGFNPAYLISAIAVTGLISWYSYTILHSIKLMTWVMLLQTGLYLFLFTILQLHDYALLAGSIGMFVILAVIMKVSAGIMKTGNSE